MRKPTQQAELRVVVRHGVKHGLIWYATLRGYDVYAGPSDHSMVFSYHESGKGHVHASRRRHRLNMPPSVSVRQIVGQQKVGGWPVRHPEWGYTVRLDTALRRTAILDAPVRNPSTIDLWLLEAGRPELAGVILTEKYQQVEITTHLHIPTTTPQLLAVVWTFPIAMRDSMLEALRAQRGLREDIR